ncbi:thioredoxin domain-containing protein [Salininema proteolyticum]|uniref:Thioredoxin domain-containing protein n=1 Tax=Salininema proteolyticum TaxID=1607685 RepID=A0ABV8TZD8_9ACTN
MNRLGKASSPYLLQHADNPVDWRPWGQEALDDAASHDRPLFVSVGYSTCHWCHVMAHESFEDDEVAAYLNDHFTSVKVDREERPDVDGVYMRATLAMTGQGGWPMSVFAFPDGTPFYAGMYFPKPNFLQLLRAVVTAWEDKREELRLQGAAIVQASATGGADFADVTVACPLDGPCPPAPPIDRDLVDNAVTDLLDQADPQFGGFGAAPKFPAVPMLRLLWEYDSPEARRTVEFAAHQMAAGGMRDQLAGGFSRYCVDRDWTVPHFEKMLYDQAELLDLYTELGEEEIASETAGFLASHFATGEGAFAAAFDADTEGEEGLTYVWTEPQLREVLSEDDADWAARTFGISDASPNFEDVANVPTLRRGVDDPERHRRVRDALLAARDQRPQPHRDGKVVTAWNALAVRSLLRYAAKFDRPDARERALTAARFLRENHFADGRLKRTSLDGRVGDNQGVLEDYAALALAAFDIGGEWTEFGKVLLDRVETHFADGEGGFFDTADDAERLVTRLSEIHDGPTASGWALAAEAFVKAWSETGEERYKDTAWRALARVKPQMEANPRFTAGLALAALKFQRQLGSRE